MIERLRVQVRAEAAGEFSSPELTFCADSYLASIPPCVTSVACKRPRSFCQVAGYTQLNMHTLLTQQSQSGLTMLSKHGVGTYQGNELTRNSSGNTQPQSSQLAVPLWTDPNLKSGISGCALISTLKKKRRRGINCRTFSQKSRTQGKSHHIYFFLKLIQLDRAGQYHRPFHLIYKYQI